jgi:hypothetical protein
MGGLRRACGRRVAYTFWTVSTQQMTKKIDILYSDPAGHVKLVTPSSLRQQLRRSSFIRSRPALSLYNFHFFDKFVKELRGSASLIYQGTEWYSVLVITTRLDISPMECSAIKHSNAISEHFFQSLNLNHNETCHMTRPRRTFKVSER